MAGKRITLKSGWLVSGLSVKKCHFAKVLQKDMWGITKEVFIVMVDGCTEIINTYKKDVLVSYAAAAKELEERRIKHIDYCKKQIKYYQDELGV